MQTESKSPSLSRENAPNLPVVKEGGFSVTLDVSWRHEILDFQTVSVWFIAGDSVLQQWFSNDVPH